jgi:hypothetical protein
MSTISTYKEASTVVNPFSQVRLFDTMLVQISRATMASGQTLYQVMATCALPEVNALALPSYTRRIYIHEFW